MSISVLIRGGGDLASGVAARLHRAGCRVLIAELPQPLVVRRLVAFAQAVYAVEAQVEEIGAVLAEDPGEAGAIFDSGRVTVLVDPELAVLPAFAPDVLVDARMLKAPPDLGMEAAALVIGLGPGFTAGENCHAVVETMRGHTLGRVIWEGSALENTGIPDSVGGQQGERVLRAPADGEVAGRARICDHLEEGDLVAVVVGEEVRAPFKGVLRGLVHDGVQVSKGMKIGDLDPRDEESYCRLISDKSLAVGGGVLEAVLSVPALRGKLC